MQSGYVIIYTHDNGGNWQTTGLLHDGSEGALRELYAGMAANPDFRYEMHPIHPNLYAALTAEKPVGESFF